MANRIQLRRDTAANWTRENPILSQGEPGFDLTANKMKVGDGVTAWTDLDYASGSGASFDYSTLQEGVSIPVGGVTSITGNHDTNTGVGLTSESWAQLMWVPDTSVVTVDDISEGASVFNWAYVDSNGFQIKNASNGNYEWKFNTDGSLSLPSLYQGTTSTIKGDSIALQVAPGATWLFDYTGITFPDNTIQTTAYTGGGAGGGASVGDFIITGTTISASTGSVSGSGFGISNLAWNSGDNTYIVSYASNPGYGYRTKVIFASTGVSQLDGNTFYLNPHNYPTNTQWELFSDLACTIKIDGSTFDAYTPGAGATNELIPGAKISIKTGTPSNNVDPGAIEFKIGGKTYGWTIDKDNHLRLPADGGASKIKNYYGKNAVFQGDALATNNITGAGTGTDVVIKSSTGISTSTWTFSADGSLTFPDTTRQSTAYAGPQIRQTTVTLTPSDLAGLSSYPGKTLVSAAGLTSNQVIVVTALEFSLTYNTTAYTTTANLYLNYSGNYLTVAQAIPAGNTTENNTSGMLTASRNTYRYIQNSIADGLFPPQQDVILMSDGAISNGDSDLRVRVTYIITTLF